MQSHVFTLEFVTLHDINQPDHVFKRDMSEVALHNAYDYDDQYTVVRFLDLEICPYCSGDLWCSHCDGSRHLECWYKALLLTEDYKDILSRERTRAILRARYGTSTPANIRDWWNAEALSAPDDERG